MLPLRCKYIMSSRHHIIMLITRLCKVTRVCRNVEDPYNEILEIKVMDKNQMMADVRTLVTSISSISITSKLSHSYSQS